MIYITGDIHGNTHRFSMSAFPEQKGLTKDDYLIVCGDFGLIWDQEETRHERRELDDLNKRSFTTLFVDGNHENHDRLNAMPVEMWHGGKIHRIRDSVIHLMRGQVYEIDDKKIFTFGGARSHDISDGILDPAEYGGPHTRLYRSTLHNWQRMGKMFRIKGLSWWPGELPSNDEIAEARKNLKATGNTVDFIVTNCLPASTVNVADICGIVQNDPLTEYLEDVKKNTHYRKWFAGHYHANMNIPMDKTIILYEQIIRIA